MIVVIIFYIIRLWVALIFRLLCIISKNDFIIIKNIEDNFKIIISKVTKWKICWKIHSLGIVSEVIQNKIIFFLSHIKIYKH